ncbi:MAG: translesion error-prone DNA polymerase V autoproteolytic subunit [Muribaculaceae bacterium]|nr:translesion error-prone DNA polymerase V autoproteolytic subunit [Muribaculaceae bacterium]
MNKNTPLSELELFRPDLSTELPLQYADDGIRAGFPSPAQDYISESIDLNRDLIRHPASTFYGRVVGDSMIEEGIEEGDILVIDKSLEPENGDLAVCCLDGEFTLKRINITRGNRIYLMPSNRRYRPIEVTPDNEFVVWGIVTYTIKANRRLKN